MPAFWTGEKSGLVKRADSLLKPFIKDLGVSDGVRLAEIKRNWSTLFQKPLLSHMSPSLLSGRELLLNVDSPVWLQELKFYKEEIVRKLSAHGVGEVRFRLGKVSVKEDATGKSKGSGCKPLNPEERGFVQDAISDIDDEGLKGTVKTAIEKAITSGKTRIR